MSPLPPQPAVERLTPFAGHPLVIGIEPRFPDLLVHTAVSFGRATGAPRLYFAHADPGRYVVEEHPDGSVTHGPLSPDSLDGDWEELASDFERRLGELLDAAGLDWTFRYLAGRPDRALTHLARAVDAAAIVVGTRAPGPGARVREVIGGSVAMHLAHHQHRPVLTVPLSVVDWRATPSVWDR